MPLNESNDTIGPVPTNCACETCKLARFESSKIRYAVVHRYSYSPRNWRLNKLRTETDPYFLGVELETDRFRYDAGSRVFSNFSNSQAADMRRPKNLWLAKMDSSVTGPEFVSHPSSLLYWQKNKAKLAEMFRMLVHAGYRSHDNDKAGMHINISRTAFADSNAHLFRFLTLIHKDTSWSLKMSQRTVASAQQWASLDYLADESRRRDECERILPSVPVGAWHRSGSSSRYQAVNAPYGQPRFEFRLPRGTLRVDRFLKNLEWTVAMIEFTRNNSLDDCNPQAFTRWVSRPAQARLYPHLVAFLRERFSPVAEAPRQTAAESGVRISPRTGRPVRQYRRRAGSRPPGRPVGFRPGNDVAHGRCTSVSEAYGVRCDRTLAHAAGHSARLPGRRYFAFWNESWNQYDRISELSGV